MSNTTDEYPQNNCSIPQMKVAEPHNLSKRAAWLRKYYFMGTERKWNNEYQPFTTGIPNDRIWSEGDYYIVPEVYGFIGVNGKGLYSLSLDLMAQKVALPQDFWNNSLPERRMLFFREVMLDYVPQEIISDNDLLAGARFNIQLSKCLNEKELEVHEKENLRNRHRIFHFHQEGFGNVGATGGHLIPDYEGVIQRGFKYYFEKAKRRYDNLTEKEQKGEKGAELRAMMMACEIPRDLAKKYADECLRLKDKAVSSERKTELQTMADNLRRVPWEPARTFWEALQSLWLTHMLVMAEESYPGPGTSFGRLDQYLWPFYRQDVIENQVISRDFAKDLFSSLIFHCNTAYDAQIRVGNQGITAGFGQLMTLSGISEFSGSFAECNYRNDYPGSRCSIYLEFR